jgi:hypothetical protein
MELTITSCHHLRCAFELRSWRGVLDTTLSHKVCQWLATSVSFSPGTLVSSANITDRHGITEILNTMNQPQTEIVCEYPTKISIKRQTNICLPWQKGCYTWKQASLLTLFLFVKRNHWVSNQRTWHFQKLCYFYLKLLF